MNKDWENSIKAFVYQELSKDCSGHDHLHAMRVVANARRIMEEEGGDAKIVVTAAYLHDCIDKKLFLDLPAQRKKVAELLRSLSYKECEMEEIFYIMDNISFSSGKSHLIDNINAKIVCDADRLDAVGALGIIRTIEYGATHGRKFYDEALNPSDLKNTLHSETSMAHFYEKLLLLSDLMFTDKAKVLAKERTLFMEQFLGEFYREAF